MNDKNILISIITPYYNTLFRTKELAKVLMPQLNKNIEWIIIDDGCYQHELDKLNAKVIHLKNNSGGASVPRNVGLDVAKGQYIIFIDSDDMVSNNYIEVILKKLKEDKNFDYCYISWSSTFGNVIIEDVPPEWNCCVWNCIYKRELIGNNRFDPKLIIAEDYDFNKRVRKGKYTSIKEMIYFYNNTINSLTKRGVINVSTSG